MLDMVENCANVIMKHICSIFDNCVLAIKDKITLKIRSC